MEKLQAVRLKDIAGKLGLSQSTVSRALSGSGRVSPGTRRRVLRAVEQSGYTPNGVARSLRMGSAKTAGILVTDITNPFFAAVIKGAQSVFREHGYSLLLANSDEDPAIEEEALGLMLEKQVSGLILATAGGAAGWIRRCRDLGVPVVFIDNMPPMDGPFDSVSIDNRKASFELTLRLIDRGCRELGIISGPRHQSTGLERLRGFEDALKSRGLPLRPEWIRQADFRMEEGRRHMEEILSLAWRPRAMVLGNNYLAYGAVAAIREAGLRIPEDIRVTGFDTENLCRLSSPAITAMNQPADEIGRQAARIALERIAGEGEAQCQQLLLEPVLSEGNSW